ncbi:ricin-type beta-trefoil lectin domain protein [Streptomyces sp. CC224B]|uniref:RICIN domain-containing protein n=1 Tax=Streptomyces sp. CC224B TaxID=3044571 RepID=UPI0024A9E14F|nr:ricin-type beta-trefoil lectin domain protein [Streptomyces sp. CC224B]
MPVGKKLATTAVSIALATGGALLTAPSATAALADGTGTTTATTSTAATAPLGKFSDNSSRATWFRLWNAGTSQCAANHHPKVFGWGCRSYTDQHWKLRNGNMLQNRKSGACLAMHSNGNVFTHRCTNSYRDQRWADGPSPGMLMNVQHRNKCLAAHSDGKIFGFRCTSSYRDQRWRQLET